MLLVQVGRGAQLPHSGHGVVKLGHGRPDDRPHVGQVRERGQVGSGESARQRQAAAVGPRAEQVDRAQARRLGVLADVRGEDDMRR